VLVIALPKTKKLWIFESKGPFHVLDRRSDQWAEYSFRRNSPDVGGATASIPRPCSNHLLFQVRMVSLRTLH